MSNNFRRGFMAALGVMSAVAAVPLTIWMGFVLWHALWNRGQALLTSPAHHQWDACTREKYSSFSREDWLYEHDGNLDAEVVLECGEEPSRWRWQTR